MDNAIFAESSVANAEVIAETIEENIKDEVSNVPANTIEDSKSSEVVASTKNESIIEEHIRQRKVQENMMFKVVKKFLSHNSNRMNTKVRVPKDKSEFEEISRVFVGFPNTEGLERSEAKSAILDYWNNEGKKLKDNLYKTYIPKDTSRYPGFPNIECLPKEEVD